MQTHDFSGYRCYIAVSITTVYKGKLINNPLLIILFVKVCHTCIYLYVFYDYGTFLSTTDEGIEVMFSRNKMTPLTLTRCKQSEGN